MMTLKTFRNFSRQFGIPVAILIALIGTISLMSVLPVRSQTNTPTAVAFQSGRLAFISRRDGNAQIYMVNPDGSNPVNISKNKFNDIDADWSPDGLHIAFASDRDGNNEICVMDADGGNQNCLTSNLTHNKKLDLKLPEDRSPVWSPDNQRIAFVTSRSGLLQIYAINADGSNPLNLTLNNANNSQPAWSPDLKKIAFASDMNGNREVCVMDASGFNQHCLTNNRTPNKKANPSKPEDMLPAWSPDSQRLAFVSTRARNKNPQIFVMNADGSNVQNITNKISADDQPSWSPDGAQIAFVSNREGIHDVFVMNADGSNQRRLVQAATGQKPSENVEPNYAPGAPSINAAPTQTLTNTPTGTIQFTPLPTDPPTATWTPTLRLIILATHTRTPSPSPTNTNVPPPPPPNTSVPPPPPTSTLVPTSTATLTPTLTPTSTPLPCVFVNNVYTVTNLSDSVGAGAAGAAGSLRLGITCANIFSLPSKTIQLPAGIITLNGGPLTLKVNMTITSAGSTINGNGQTIFVINPTVTNATINIITLKGGAADTNGFGGNIKNHGVLNLDNCMVLNGGAFNGGGNIYNSGTLNIGNCSIGNGGATGDGANILNVGTLRVVNSTIFGGTATGGSGAIANNGGNVDLFEVTVSGNLSWFSGAINNQSGSFKLRNTIIAKNIANSPLQGQDVSGTFIAQNYNLVESFTGATGFGGTDILGAQTPPLLEAIGNVNTTEFVFLLPAGSPAIDRVPCSIGFGIDQRGAGRPQGSACDIGSIERQASDP